MTRTLSLATLLALSACVIDDGSTAGETDLDSLIEVLPDDRVLVNMPTDDDSTTARAELGEWSEFYLVTADATDSVNGLIGSVLRTVDAIVHSPPTSFDRAAMAATWGPFSDTLDPVDTMLYVERDADTGLTTWVFLQKSKGVDDAEWIPVIAGEVDPGATRIASSGRFVIDFTQMHELDPTTDQLGVFWSEYDIAPDLVSATAAVDEWQNLVIDDQPTAAAYVYAQTPDGDGHMDLAWEDDYLGDGEMDVYVLRSRWDATGAGRGDAVLAEGGDELVGAVTECWDDSFALVYRADTWEGSVGEVHDCVYTEPDYAE
ncbi:MAG: hypothetical protein D6798_10565 [Deltaproteobacteria bacterium]|nr:MAG: hypothetical protein D6798_10565 [Deltaproteobacteria bacterium]